MNDISSKLACQLRILGNAVRLRILKYFMLHRGDWLSINDLVKALNLPQPRVSEHVKVLQRMRVIRQQDGANRLGRYQADSAELRGFFADAECYVEIREFSPVKGVRGK